jgi:sortase A
MEPAIQTRPEAPYTELRTARRPRAIEFAVLALTAAIVLAMAFTGYAVVYRLWVGPGLSDPPPVAQALDSSEVERPATLVPTYTPTTVPGPTLPPPTPTVALPTPLPEPALAVAVPPARPAADSPPTRLVIAKIGLDIPVLPVGVKTVTENGKSRALWADVPNAGGFHETSSLPGHLGNTVINGHRDILGSVFRHLDQVEVGNEILLYVGDVAYPYRVTETLVVPETFASAKQRAENLRLIGPMPEERLTLVTCTPVGLATHRLLVVARPPEQASPDMPAAGSDPAP